MRSETVAPLASIPPTGACNSSASSTSRVIPLGVRAQRWATISGASAATRSRAASRTAPASPAGGEVSVSLGVRGAGVVIGRCCMSESATRSTGAIGGVIAIR